MCKRVHSHGQTCSTAFLPAEYRAVQAQQACLGLAWLGLDFLTRTFWLELKLSQKGFYISTGWTHFGTLCSTVSPSTNAASQGLNAAKERLTQCPAQGVYKERIPTLMCWVISTSQGLMLHRRLSFRSRHWSLSLEILVEMPSPQVLEQGLQGEVCTMQFFCQASSSPSYAVDID